MQTVENQWSPPVYTAQVNSSRQMDRQVESANISSFFDWKKQLSVGMNVKAQMMAVRTMKNQESVWLTARLQIKQVSRAMA